MADRGEILRLKRRLGFAAKGEAESVVVVQASPLNAVLPTTVVVPLHPATTEYAGHPIAIRVSRREAGSSVDHVAINWGVRAVSSDAFAPGPVGRLEPATLNALEDAIKLVLGLR